MSCWWTYYCISFTHIWGLNGEQKLIAMLLCFVRNWGPTILRDKSSHRFYQMFTYRLYRLSPLCLSMSNSSMYNQKHFLQILFEGFYGPMLLTLSLRWCLTINIYFKTNVSFQCWPNAMHFTSVTFCYADPTFFIWSLFLSKLILPFYSLIWCWIIYWYYRC
jgi:hypothetical protein